MLVNFKSKCLFKISYHQYTPMAIHRYFVFGELVTMCRNLGEILQATKVHCPLAIVWQCIKYTMATFW